MSDKKLKLTKKQIDRLAKNETDYSRLVKKAQQSLEHHSPGLWGWFDDTIDAAVELGKEAVNIVNDAVDKYIWDTSQDEAAIEGWVRDTFDLPDQEAKGFLGEAGDKVSDYGKDLYVNGADLLDDIPNKAKEFVETTINNVKETYTNTNNTIRETYTNTKESIGDILNKIDITVPSIDFSFLEPLLELPIALASLNAVIKELFTFDMQDYYETAPKLKQVSPSV